MIQIKIDATKLVASIAKVVVRHGIEAWQMYIAGSQAQKRIPGGSQAQERIHGGSRAGAFLPKMTRKEAAMILGVSESAVEEKIKEAHRRAMIANHPDAGGSNYLASKINEAKDVMMGKTWNSGFRESILTGVS